MGLVAVFIVFPVLFAVFSGFLAESKNRDVAIWAIIGLLFGPFGLIVAFLPVEEEGEEQNLNAKKIQCKKCRELIQFNAKICRHCGIQFPYLSEPARTHVELISELFVKGESPPQIAETLNKKSIHPANQKKAWDTVDITQIIKGHID